MSAATTLEPRSTSFLDWRGRLGWKIADAATWLQREASGLQYPASDLKRGEIRPTLPLLLGQLDDVARSMGTKPSVLVEQMDLTYWTDGTRR